jgi:adenylate kinase family enzyme
LPGKKGQVGEMSRNKPILLMLIGPKGAGKTHLARMIEAHWGAPYLHIEPIWQELQRERSDFGSPAYIEAGLQRVLDYVATELARQPLAVLDGTGAFPAFAGYLARLQELAEVKLIKLIVPPDICLQRVQTRDQTQQVQMDLAAVAQMNVLSAALELPWHLVLHNHPPLAAADLVAALQPLLGDPR